MSNKRTIIQVRRGTSSEWSNSQPQPNGEVLRLGEPGYEKDTGKLKIGDGIKGWNELPYLQAGNDQDVIVTAEDVEDVVGNLLIAGDGIGIDYDDENNELTIRNTKQTHDAAVQWTANHTLVDGTRYLAGDLVYSNGRLYKANYDNESMPVSNTTYWTDIGPGYRLNIDGRDIPNIPYPSKLEELDNVSLNNPTNGQFLQYNAANSSWVASSTGNFTSLSVNNVDFNVAVSGAVENSLSTSIVAGSGINVNYNSNTDTLTISIASDISGLTIDGGTP